MPQVSDEDLEDLVKLGKTGADALATASQGNASSALLQDYNETPRGAQTARTPRAPAAQDNILTEAQNILALNQTNSVLEVDALFALVVAASYCRVGWREHAPSRARRLLLWRNATATGACYSEPRVKHSLPRLKRGCHSRTNPRHVGEYESVIKLSSRLPSHDFLSVVTTHRLRSQQGQTPMRDGLGINVESDSSLMTPRTEGERARHSDLRSDLAVVCILAPAYLCMTGRSFVMVLLLCPSLLENTTLWYPMLKM